MIEAARRIVRDEGTDSLTLGYLARVAGVSKPVVYDHFRTLDGLLIELYRLVDTERVDAFSAAMAVGRRSSAETVEALAQAYIACAVDLEGEFHAIGSALAGTEEKARVFQDLLSHSVGMFVNVLSPHSTLSAAELRRRCVALVGAGEALAASVLRSEATTRAAIASFRALIAASLRS
ncbi:MAG: TetR/AcrR family transcriptional regulator [Sphingomonas sp.]|nr:MAG: TetR/AcrR family transcriptional regulator [Sphingomonas sp.]